MATTVTVRLEGDEEACIGLVRAWLQDRVGPGVRIGDSDAVRYSLHLAANTVAADMAAARSKENSSNGD